MVKLGDGVDVLQVSHVVEPKNNKIIVMYALPHTYATEIIPWFYNSIQDKRLVMKGFLQTVTDNSYEKNSALYLSPSVKH